MSKRPSTKKAGRKSSAKAKPRAKRSAAPEPIEILPPKRGRGRPTTYSPDFCERVIELGAEGKSKWQIARDLGCSRKTLYAWVKAHPEFAEAMEESQDLALAWWEDVGQQGLKMGSKFNASVYSYLMKNRFREHYSDKVGVEHSGKVEADPAERQLTDLEIARRIAFIFHEGMKPDAATSLTLSSGGRRPDA
jgi:helix-turn-helix resolvase-like protein